MTRGAVCVRQRGSASVLVAFVCVGVLVLGLAGALAAAGAQAAAAARSAADLSALAAARAQVDGLSGWPSEPACTVAGQIALSNGAVLRRCDIDDGVNVSVQVQVSLATRHSWVPDRFTALVSARAGPAP